MGGVTKKDSDDIVNTIDGEFNKLQQARQHAEEEKQKEIAEYYTTLKGQLVRYYQQQDSTMQKHKDEVIDLVKQQQLGRTSLVKNNGREEESEANKLLDAVVADFYARRKDEIWSGASETVGLAI